MTFCFKEQHLQKYAVRCPSANLLYPLLTVINWSLCVTFVRCTPRTGNAGEGAESDGSRAGTSSSRWFPVSLTSLVLGFPSWVTRLDRSVTICPDFAHLFSTARLVTVSVLSECSLSLFSGYEGFAWDSGFSCLPLLPYFILESKVLKYCG